MPLSYLAAVRGLPRSAARLQRLPQDGSVSLPIVNPDKLIERQAARGFWPTAMRYREEEGRLVGTVEAWGRKSARTEEPELPTSSRGISQGRLL